MGASLGGLLDPPSAGCNRAAAKAAHKRLFTAAIARTALVNSGVNADVLHQ